MGKQKKQHTHLKRRLRSFSLFVLLVIALFSISLYRQNSQMKQLNHQKKGQQNKLNDLKSDSAEIKHEMKLLQTDDEYILDIARKEYFLTKEGETIFVLPEDKPKKKK
jgi:cell division protein DivIC